MLSLVMLTTRAGLRDQDEFEAIVGALQRTGYKPVVRTMFSSLSESVGITVPSSVVTKVLSSTDTSRLRRQFQRNYPKSYCGEMFFADDHMFILVPSSDSLRVYGVASDGCEQIARDFASHVERTARHVIDGRRLRGMDFDWRLQEVGGIDYRRRPQAFSDEVALKTVDPDYDSDEAEAASLLVAAPTRTLLLRLAQVVKARRADALTGVEPDAIEAVFAHGLVAREYLLVCKQDQHTKYRVLSAVRSIVDKTR